MPKFTSIAAILGTAAVFAAAVGLRAAPALAQDAQSGAEAFRAGVMLGRSLHDPQECGGSGDYYEGCLGGVEEGRFDREADAALNGETGDEKPSEPSPLFSPPSGLFQDPYSKPGESQPPNR